MERLIYVILGFGIVGNIGIYYGLYKVRKYRSEVRVNGL